MYCLPFNIDDNIDVVTLGTAAMFMFVVYIEENSHY